LEQWGVVRAERVDDHTWKTAELGETMEKEDWTPEEESAADAAATSWRCRSYGVAEEASISPECCLAVHSPPFFRHTKVYTPMTAAGLVRCGGGFGVWEAGEDEP
jgi:hypothetical protein